ncbi:MAG: hypothetical protein D6805_06435 [Planctomycetota bacterium]|nr:MAG: hypothetical protein D6805_06435 [Planctomycetota bacterium]
MNFSKDLQRKIYQLFERWRRGFLPRNQRKLEVSSAKVQEILENLKDLQRELKNPTLGKIILDLEKKLERLLPEDCPGEVPMLEIAQGDTFNVKMVYFFMKNEHLISNDQKEKLEEIKNTFLGS